MIAVAQVSPRINEVTPAKAAIILCPDVILLDQLRPAYPPVTCVGPAVSFSFSVPPLTGRTVRVQAIRLLLSQWDVPSFPCFLWMRLNFLVLRWDSHFPYLKKKRFLIFLPLENRKIWYQSEYLIWWIRDHFLCSQVQTNSTTTLRRWLDTGPACGGRPAGLFSLLSLWL